MALERSLWQRVRTGWAVLRKLGHKIVLSRIENLVDEGTPDVEGCIAGVHIWLELKSCDRPVRPSTPIRFRTNKKTYISQTLWHRERAAAGCRHNFVLIQVGDASQAKLYLIPGYYYDKLKVPEIDLELMSVLSYSNA